MVSNLRTWFLLQARTWLQRVHYIPWGCSGMPTGDYFSLTIMRGLVCSTLEFWGQAHEKIVQGWHCTSASQRRRCGNIKAAKAWSRIQEQLFGELGLWGQMVEATPCSRWELDWREGPARMRKRIRRLSPLEVLSEQRLKVRVWCRKTATLRCRKCRAMFP